MATNKSKTNKPQARPDFVVPRAQQVPKEKKSFVFIGIKANVLLIVSCVLFAAYAAYMLIVKNGDLLYQAQNYSFFFATKEFFDQCMQKPGGLLYFCSAYLTQFYYDAPIGASIQVAIWALSFFVAKKAFKVPSVWASLLLIPIAAQLISIIGVEYWLYYIKQIGYWFNGTLGFFIAMLFVLLSRISKKPVIRMAVAVVLACTYAFVGFYAVLASLYICLDILTSDEYKKESKPMKIVVPASILTVVIAHPLIMYYAVYTGLKIERLWIEGFPIFVSDTTFSWVQSIPYIVISLFPFILPLLPKKTELKGMSAVASVLLYIVVFIGSVFCSYSRHYDNYNYHAEIRMYKAVEESDWDKVLSEMTGNPGDANRQMVLMKNIALLNKGELGSKMFKYNNMGDNPVNDYDTLHVFMMQTGAPMLYLHHAKTNFAIRWCVENMVEYGPSFNNLKVLTKCSIINEEWDAARKYLTILQNTMFYKDWAEKYMPLVDNPKRIAEFHEFDNIRELRDHMGTVLDGDQGLCEMYLLNYFSNTMNKDSKLLQELTLIYAMVQKDIQLFWPRFFLYASMHKGEDMPIHYQEAAYLYGNLEHQVDISNMPFDKEKVISRYNGFQQLSQSLLASGMTSEQVGESMKSSYGDTFYWFYFFCRDIKSY